MVYLFLEDGFEEVEAMAPIDILRRAGVKITTVGEEGISVTGAHGVRVKADMEVDSVSFADMEMVVLPGGPGTHNHESCPKVRESLEYCAKSGKYIAAICAAPSVLGHYRLLKGRSAVCYPGYEKDLGAGRVLTDPVCVSGNIVTARGAGVAVDFALKLVEVLCGVTESQKIRKSIQCI